MALEVRSRSSAYSFASRRASAVARSSVMSATALRAAVTPRLGPTIGADRHPDPAKLPVGPADLVLEVGDVLPGLPEAAQAHGPGQSGGQIGVEVGDQPSGELGGGAPEDGRGASVRPDDPAAHGDVDQPDRGPVERVGVALLDAVGSGLIGPASLPIRTSESNPRDQTVIGTSGAASESIPSPPAVPGAPGAACEAAGRGRGARRRPEWSGGVSPAASGPGARRPREARLTLE